MGSLCTIWNNKVGQEPFLTNGIGFLLTGKSFSEDST